MMPRLLGTLFALLGIIGGLVFFASSAFADTPEFLTQNLKLGSTGDEVTLLQTWLAEDKKIYPEGLVNGTYGPATERAVKRYQEKKGMILFHAWGGSSYGSVGPMTRANLNSEYSKNQGGISSVEAKYGDGLVLQKTAFVPLIEKQYAANTPVVNRINLWINPAALSVRDTAIFATADGYGIETADEGKLVAIAPQRKAVTANIYLIPGKWQHVQIIFTGHDAVFIYNNDVVETIPLEQTVSENFFDRIFGSLFSAFKTLSVSTNQPSSFPPAPSHLARAPASHDAPRGIIGSLLAFFDDLIGFSPPSEYPPAISEGVQQEESATTSGPTPIPVFHSVAVVPPSVKPNLIPNFGPTTTIVTVVSTATPSFASSSTPPLAIGSSSPATGTSTPASSTPPVAGNSTGGGSASAAAANHAPTITLSGSANVSQSIGSIYTDPGATATDAEDGDVSSGITVAGDTVDPNNPGDYHITYNVTDSKGLAATQVTRTVTVNPPASVPESQQVPNYTLAPVGQDASYSVSSGGGDDPAFSNIDINPLHVYVGQNQTFTVTASSPGGVASVRAVTQLDTTTLTLDLVKTLDNGDSATFAKSWDVYDTHTQIYRTVFTATANSGATNSMTMAWSDPCTISSNHLTANCAVSIVDGNDGASLTIDTGVTLTLNSGATWAFNPGTSVFFSGTAKIVKGTGGTLRKGYLFYNGATNSTANTAVKIFDGNSASTTAVRVNQYSQSTYYAQSTYYGQGSYYSQSGYCFAPDTLVQMADGTRKPSKDVRVGDIVLGQEENGARRANIVTKLFDHNYNENGLITYAMLDINHGLIVRAEHPMFTTRGLVDAGDLTLKDTLIGISGLVPVASIETGPDLPEVYNLEVFPDHDYFAGGVLVHNKLHQNVNPP